MPQADSEITTRPETNIINLADWRAAGAEERRQIAQTMPHIYAPRQGDGLANEIARIDTGVYLVARGLVRGSLAPDKAATLLCVIHQDLEAAVNKAAVLARKFKKAKRKAKNRTH